jgi:uncharacterized protein involved in outer membrane biogenesis
MKKIVVVSLGLLFLAVLVAFVFGFVLLGSVVKAGVEKVGPMVLKVPVKLEGASVSVFSGKGELNGFQIANPEGFKSPNAIKVGSVAMALQPKSVLADKIIINSINVQGPEITYETDLKGSNLAKILDNVKEMAGPAKTQPAEPGKKPKKLQVDEFVITGGKISVAATMLGGKGATLPLPEIRLANLGQGPEGITGAELAEKVLSAVTAGTVKAVAEGGAALAKDAVAGAATAATNVLKKAGSEGTKALQKVGDLFNKK